ncbi:VOC family protein [Polaromonas sp.]|uniref:VOC family protein n=1 Tax=Polaromonas sp. TaxID=1869339 RepID=UPI003266FE62
MIDHLSFGVTDIARSRLFYDGALGALGYRMLSGDDRALGYGADEPVLWLYKTSRAVQSGPESGLHVAFKAADRDAVAAFHRQALQLGGHDNGVPGLRSSYGPSYYAAFAIDPDGYRLEAHCELAKATP